MNMKTSPCLILISLLFDYSCKGIKGTCPSYLAVVMSGRHNTHLVTLSSMSVAHYYWHSFSTPLCSHLHWCISITSTSAAWYIKASVTSPMGLSGLALAVCKQTNKLTHTATGTYNNFILYQPLLQHASYLWLTVFKTMIMPCQTTQQNCIFLGLVAAILNWGHTHHNRSNMNPIQVYTAYNLYTVNTPARRT